MFTDADRYKELILAYLEDALEPHEKKDIELHLKDCKDCQEELKQSKDLIDVLKGMRFNPHIITKECINIDIAKYVFKEMTSDEVEKTKKHISTCDHCLHEVINLRATEESIFDECEYNPLQDLIKIKSYIDRFFKGFTEAINLPITLRRPIMADEGFKIISIKDVIFKIEVSKTIDKNIRLIDPNNCPDNLMPIKQAIDGHIFYYKIFGIYENEKIKVIKTGDDDYLPIIIDVPDTNFLMLFISQNKDSLDILDRLLPDFLVGKSKEKIKDMVCIFVEIKRNGMNNE